MHLIVAYLHTGFEVDVAVVCFQREANYLS